MATSRQWQLDAEGARRYEEVVVPFILGPSARALVEWAGPGPGDRVLDVGCGTGIATRLSLPMVEPGGRISGIDINAGMIAVARELAPEIEFQVADAAASQLGDGSFDLVLCAQVLQFVPDRPAAIREMARLAAPGGRIAMSTWGPLESNPYFAAQVNVIREYFGDDVTGRLTAAFTLTNAGELASLLTGSGLEQLETTTATLALTLDHLDEFIPRHIMTTSLAAGFAAADPLVKAAIVHDVRDRLSSFTAEDGKTTVPFQINLARATRAAD